MSLAFLWSSRSHVDEPATTGTTAHRLRRITSGQIHSLKKKLFAHLHYNSVDVWGFGRHASTLHISRLCILCADMAPRKRLPIAWTSEVD
jgi:hypothetical protein